jgi:hypothetical protein
MRNQRLFFPTFPSQRCWDAPTDTRTRYRPRSGSFIPPSRPPGPPRRPRRRLRSPSAPLDGRHRRPGPSPALHQDDPRLRPAGPGNAQPRPRERERERERERRKVLARRRPRRRASDWTRFLQGTSESRGAATSGPRWEQRHCRSCSRTLGSCRRFPDPGPILQELEAALASVPGSRILRALADLEALPVRN